MNDLVIRIYKKSHFIYNYCFNCKSCDLLKEQEIVYCFDNNNNNKIGLTCF